MQDSFIKSGTGSRHNQALNRRAIASAVAVTAAMLCGSYAEAAPTTWLGATANFNDGANWSPGLPVSGDSWIFDVAGAGGTTLNNDLTTNAFVVAGITFNALAPAYTINPAVAGTNDFVMTGNLVNNSASLQTINSEMVNGTADFAVSGSGDTALQRVQMATVPRTLTMNGTGALTLGNANTSAHMNFLALVVNSGTVNLNTAAGTNYIVVDRGLTLNGGTVRYTGTSTNMLADAQTLTITSGTFDMNGLTDTIGSLNGTGGTILNGAAATTSTLTVGNTNTSGNYSGTITNGAGTMSITKAGTGTQTLSGTNSYSGNTTVTGGMLNIAGASAIGTSTLVLQGGNFDNTTGGPLSLSNNLTINGASAFGGSANVTFTGTNTITANSNFQLSGNGGKILTISTPLTNTVDADRNLSFNPQNIDNSYVFSNTAVVLGDIAISSAATAPRTFTIGGGNGANSPVPITVNGVISDGSAFANNLTLSNSGTVTLNGANTFTGTANVGGAGGTHSQSIIIGNKNALGSDAGTIIFNSATLQASTPLTGANRIQRNVTFRGGVGANVINGGIGEIGGTNALEFSGTFTNDTGNRTLWVTNTGGTTLSGTNLFLSEAVGTARTLSVIANGPTTISAPIANANGGGLAGILTIVGNNTLTLSGSNTYTGQTNLRGATTILDYSTNDNSKFSDTAALVVDGGANVVLSGGSHTELVSGLTLNSGGSINITRPTGTAKINLNTITIGGTGRAFNATSGAATTDINNSANGILGGYATVNGADFAMSVNTLAADTPITAYSAYQTGADSGWLATDNVAITAGGPLTGTRVINTLKATSTGLDIGAANTLTLNAGGLLHTGSGNNAISNGTLKGGQAGTSELIVHQHGSGTLEISSVIANGNGASQLTKAGDGTLILSGANTYTGTTNITKGTLKLGAHNAINPGATQDVQLSGGAKFDLNGFNQTLRNLNVSANSNSIGAGEVTNSGALSTLTLNTTATNGTSNLLYSGNLAVNVKNPGLVFEMNNPRNSFTGGLKISGNGTALALSQLNAAGGLTRTTTGRIRFNAENGPGVGTITLDNGSIFTPSTTGYLISNPIAVTANGGEINTDSNATAHTGAITSTGGSPLLVLMGSAARPSLNLSGNNSGFSGTFAVDSTNTNLNLSGAATGSSNANLLFFGSGALGNVNWNGALTPTTISFGELTSGTIGAGGGRLRSNVATTVTYQIGRATSNTTTFAGFFENGNGTVNLVKTGTNTQILSGTNTYTGTTTVSGGVLNVTGSLAAGTAATVNGGTLSTGGVVASGTVNGPVTVNSGGIVHGGAGGNFASTVAVNGGAKLTGTTGTFSGTVTVAGGASAGAQGSIDLVNNSIGTLNFGSTLALGGAAAGQPSILKFEVGDVGNNADQLSLFGNPTPFTVNAGGAQISIINFGNLVGGGQQYTLASFPNGATGAGFAIGSGTTVGGLSLDPATINFGPLNAQLVVSATDLKLQINGVVITPTTAYWTGAVDSVWNTFSGPNANFATTAAGTTPIQGFLASTTDVFFTANTATNLTNTLGQNFNILGLTFTGTGTSGTGAIAIAGNTVGANTLSIDTGGIKLNSGSGGATLGMTNLNLSSSQVWANNSASNLTVNAAIGGSGSLTINSTGSGKIILAGANTYANGTTVQAGAVQLSGSGSFGTGALTVDGGTVDLNNVSTAVTSFNGTGGTILNNNSGTATLTTANGGTYSGSIVNNTNAGTGKVALAVTGGAMTLSGSNTFTGGASISNASLTKGSAGALGASSNPISLISGVLSLNGFNTTIDSLSGDVNSTVNNGAVGNITLTLNPQGVSTTNFNGSIADDGVNLISLIKTGTGNVGLKTNTYAGNTSLTAGSVTLVNGATSPFGTGAVTLNTSTPATPVIVSIGGSGNSPLSANSTYIPNNVTVTGTNIIDNSLGGFANLWIGGAWTGTGNAVLRNGGTGSTAFLFLGDTMGGYTGTISLDAPNSSTAIAFAFVSQNELGGGGALVDFSQAAWVLGSNPAGGSSRIQWNNTIVPSGTVKLGSLAGVSPLSQIKTNGTVAVTYEVGALNTNTSYAGQIIDGVAGTGGITSLTKVGTGTLTLSGDNPYTGPTNVNAGKLVTGPALQSNSALSIATAAVLEVPVNGGATRVSRFKSVTTAGTGKLELHDNDLIVDYTGDVSPYAAVLTSVKSGLPLLGFGGDGSGITSAEVIAQGAGGIGLNGTMLGVIDGATTGGQVTSLSGFTVPNPTTSVLVKYTWRGDANLDGVVNGSDYALADTGFSGGGTGWFYGDVNYDGVINGSDYALIDTGFSSQTGPLPEPAMLSLLGLGAMGVLRRRRRAV
ncbi:MAG: autotransporter-associated beta strand repeat-containing protein [Burkholderiales bacterium]|nr:autotransporter-associated beta strand repeat-containing protein [Phycisphaerae bacterium]